MKLLLGILLLFAVSCNSDTEPRVGIPEYFLSCKKAGRNYIRRCENEEVICYYESGTGISCKFKDNS